MTITPELIEIFQQPPTPREPDMGAVDPFSETELAAIAKYNQAITWSEDSLPEDSDALFNGPGEEGLKFPLATIVNDAFCYMHSLTEWHTALDTLHADLSANRYGSPSNAADRLLSYEARRLLSHRDTAYAAIARWVTGMAGPRLTDGAFELSNGYVFPAAAL